MTQLVWVFSLVMVLIGFAFDALIIRNMSTVCVVVSGLVFVLLRKQHFVTSAWLMSSLIMFVAFYTSYIGYGIMDVSVLLLPMGVMFAGMILPLQQVWFSVIIRTTLAVFLALTHAMGHCPTSQISTLLPRLCCFSDPRLRLSSDDALHDASIEKSLYRTRGKAALARVSFSPRRWDTDCR